MLLLPPKLSPAALHFCFRGTAPASPSSSSLIRFYHGLPFSWHITSSVSHHWHPGVTTQASAAHLRYQSPTGSTPGPRAPTSPLRVEVHSLHSPSLSSSSAGLKNVLCWVVCENLNCNEEVVPSACCADQCCLICSLM